MPLAPLHKEFKISSIHLASYQAASVAGDCLVKQVNEWAQMGQSKIKAKRIRNVGRWGLIASWCCFEHCGNS